MTQRRHTYRPRHRKHRVGQHWLLRLAGIAAMAGSALVVPVTSGAAHAGTPPLPVCGDIATCVSMAEQLAQPVLGQPCGGAVVTDCIQPAILAVQNRMT